MTEPGLRERKKQQTRRTIIDTATRLFAARGFEQVPVAEVARAADVSVATVFNYFPTKEDMVYDGMDDFEAALVEALRQRPAGERMLDTFRAFVLRPHSLVDHPEAVARIAAIARVVKDSAALQARERLVFDRYTRALADLVAEETSAKPHDVEPWVVANALMGVNRALKDFVHDQALAGRTGKQIAKDVLAQGRRALALLEAGLAG
ncbi:MAG: TetR family transcriptional regulator [Actinophytocola sp.]|uniref:TetR/AcrR family transcriptional regulator n=1 Tax=Actinophytocola sp. TaxID=1872138 RepID=UPI00132A9D97|nr:TetR family transcriptional regulator [Actinophytocola sp.]MPZ86201.1 TetR family transcriptional regulator [Actinophytocola sp.]